MKTHCCCLWAFFSLLGSISAWTNLAFTPTSHNRVSCALSCGSLSLQQQISRRRNLAIISHPDAGKTTLTEKLLLYGGAIQEAGAVRSRANQRRARSDWMEIEKQRGISITSTVLTFAYKDKIINLLDTPGHQDFSEDTYRTLAAADNCVMLIDAAKGLEPQTRKLFEVCRMRNLPVFTFFNKMDRPSMPPAELIEQIEKEFGLQCAPVNWPIGNGDSFHGVLSCESKQVHLYNKGLRTGKAAERIYSLQAEEVRNAMTVQMYNKIQEDAHILEELYAPVNTTAVAHGLQTPVYFGAAVNNFGVDFFLQSFLNLSSEPIPRTLMNGEVLPPSHQDFVGFVFKLQANLDPKHRDRMAFVRVCSGTFNRGMKVCHPRSGRHINLARAQSLFAQDRESVDEAFPGDVIGVHNPGILAIGDTLHGGSRRMEMPGIPCFSPEVFAYIRNSNPSHQKQFKKGLDELLQEGAVQFLRDRADPGSGPALLAAVGQLQLDVVQYRLKSEYNVDVVFEPITFNSARWCEDGWEKVDQADADGKLFGVFQAQDQWQRPVLLFRSPWKIQQAQKEANLTLVPWAMPPTSKR